MEHRPPSLYEATNHFLENLTNRKEKDLQINEDEMKLSIMTRKLISMSVRLEETVECSGVIESIKFLEKSTRVQIKGVSRMLFAFGVLPNEFKVGYNVKVLYELLLVNSYKQAWIISIKCLESKKNV